MADDRIIQLADECLREKERRLSGELEQMAADAQMLYRTTSAASHRGFAERMGDCLRLLRGELPKIYDEAYRTAPEAAEQEDANV